MLKATVALVILRRACDVDRRDRRETVRNERVAPLVLAGIGVWRLLIDPLRVGPRLGAPILQPAAMGAFWLAVAIAWHQIGLAPFPPANRGYTKPNAAGGAKSRSRWPAAPNDRDLIKC